MPKIAYRFVFDDLSRLILSGQIGRPGDILPAENTLAARYRISRPTIRKVLQMLAEENLLESKAGIGWRIISQGKKKEGQEKKNKHIRIGIDTEFDLWGYFYYDRILNGLKKGARDCNCELVLLKESEDEKLDGILLSRVTPEIYEKYLPAAESGIPVVILNRIPEDLRFFAFSIDHEAEARKAVEYLLLLGHRRIAVLMDRETEILQSRLNGWYLAFASNGLMAPEDLILRDSSFAGIEDFFREKEFTAFFVLQGTSLGKVMLVAERCGMQIPEELSLFCFDNMDLVPFLDRPVSHIRMPLEEMGERAVHAIAACLRHPRKTGFKPRREILESELVISASCKNINRQKIISDLGRGEK